MLKNFKVKNFRNFKDWFEFDFSTNKNYEFNANAIKDQIVNHGIIYGRNGSGKSNVGLAIVDITSHLKDDINTIPSLFDNYLNGDSGDDIAEFSYTFDFNGIEVHYKYGKYDRTTLAFEDLSINGRNVIQIDRRESNIAQFNLKGAEHLKNDLSSNTKISALKYLNANAVLDELSSDNKIINMFFDFVDGMVFFRTLKDKTESYGQLMNINRISEAIISNNKISDFESFLNDAEIECKLEVFGEQGNERIHFVFENSTLEFSRAASTGTISLGIFYYWWMQLESSKLSFAYIDEFDAYYHFELSRAIVKLLNKVDAQTLLTTHNTSLMTNDLLRPDCYFELKDKKQFHFFDLFNKEIRKAHNLEKLYRSKGSDE